MYRYSGTPLVRPPHLYQKCGLSRGFASRQGHKSIHLWLNLHFQRGWPLVRVASQKGFNCTYIDIHSITTVVIHIQLFQMAAPDTWETKDIIFYFFTH